MQTISIRKPCNLVGNWTERQIYISRNQILGYWRHRETQISTTMSLEMVESLEIWN